MVHNFSAHQPLNVHFQQQSNGNRVDSRDMELPAYAPTPNASYAHAPAEYVITMDDHSGRAFWTMRIASRSTSSKSLPIFIEGDPIEGRVQVNLQKPDHIKAIIVLVKGLVVYSAYDSKTFVEVSQTLWENSTAHSPTPFNGLPPGNFFWPFSLSLPPQVELSEKEAVDYGLAYGGRLPPSLGENEGHASIKYLITLRVKRSGLFHHYSKLSTFFGYYPATRPDPPSRLRALAYEEKLPILGPDGDPEGWEILPEVRLVGTLFKAVEVTLSISLALPTPLAYPRGTAFPCAIILTSNNKQAVHLLSSPNALVVEMHRKLQTAVGESMVGGALVFNEDDRCPFTKANWHPADVLEVNGVYTCTVTGELSLPPNLVPSFTLGGFNCEYVVDVYPPAAPGFEPASHDRLSRAAVAVTSLLADGPRPRSYLPLGNLAPDAAASDRDMLTRSLLRADSFA